jgi:hypothetical protein
MLLINYFQSGEGRGGGVPGRVPVGCGYVSLYTILNYAMYNYANLENNDTLDFATLINNGTNSKTQSAIMTPRCNTHFKVAILKSNTTT